MFTVKIVNNNDHSSSIRSWPDVDIFKKGTEEFINLMELEKEKWKHEGLSDDQKDSMIESIETHSAVIRSHTEPELKYYLCEHQTAYIMDSAGNTVECIR